MIVEIFELAFVVGLFVFIRNISKIEKEFFKRKPFKKLIREIKNR